MTNQGYSDRQMLGRALYAAGVPLTDSMELTDRDGSHWIAYIEGVPLPRGRRWRRPTGFPGRRLRFDSVAGSRAVTPVPAGSPFLSDVRLQGLLDRSQPLDAIVAVTTPSAGWRSRLVEWQSRTARHAAAVLAETGRQWRQMRTGAGDRLLEWVTERVGSGPRARW
jgi:hypothetical protein